MRPDRRVILRTDWFRILADIQHHGCTNSDVAAYIECPLGTVRGWKEGSEPRHHDGHRLVDLWQQMTGQAFADRPTCRG